MGGTGRGEAGDPKPPLFEEEPPIESPARDDPQSGCPALPTVPSSINATRRRGRFVQLVTISATLSLAAMVTFTGDSTHVTGSCGGGSGTSFESLGRESGEDSGSRLATKDNELRIFVEDCARKLELPEDVCEPEKPIRKNSFQVPPMSSGNLDCGFEGLMSKDEMEGLAAKYAFAFVGASTSRRLAESFVSIYTGVGSGHAVVHGPMDYSAGHLEVKFQWSAYCAGRTGLAAGISNAIDSHRQGEHSHKRLVIVTGYGVHDASFLKQYQDLDMSLIAPGGNGTEEYSMYADARERGVLARDGCSLYALASCRQITSELLELANGGARPVAQPYWRGGEPRKMVNAVNNEKRSKGKVEDQRPQAHQVVVPGSAESRVVGWDAWGADGEDTQEAELEEGEVDAAKEDVDGDGRRLRGGQSAEGAGTVSHDALRRSQTLGDTAAGVRRGQAGVVGAAEASARSRDGGAAGGSDAASAHGVAKEPPQKLSMSAVSATRGKGEERIDIWAEETEKKSDKEQPEQSPLVFVFQGNNYQPSDPRRAWLTELRDMQRQVFDGTIDTRVESAAASPSETREPTEEDLSPGRPMPAFLINDAGSLFDTMACYRGDEIHFLEPVKLVEAKMFWHLMALVDKRLWGED